MKFKRESRKSKIQAKKPMKKIIITYNEIKAE